MKTLADIREIVARCAYPGFEFKVDADGDIEQLYPWCQIVCHEGVDTTTGQPASWTGRKWKLSFHMTDTEIVHSVWAAVQRALLHEAAELFKFDEAAIFDRHIDVHRLAYLINSHANVLDERADGMQAA